MHLDDTHCGMLEQWDDLQGVIDLYLILERASNDPAQPSLVNGSPITYHNGSRVSHVGEVGITYDSSGELMGIGGNFVGRMAGDFLRIGWCTAGYTPEGRLSYLRRIPFPELTKPQNK